ncbi:predicted protein [Naegleria gruberi]|uniref:Autophagy-related protein 27 n=1 Tax=Naegleria gruberi TaxID=5762 RepID=D2VVP7_NAEGR|nr:uncharacterized protein NAEGRDRAFT_73096 [Naegleria gruberi]EFC39078.1 predicted protein [Naegleria gruberi]|eukprot:XP_002671822.1 predicted protein [Naegleria gruberi strain NEG-M]
MLSKKFLLLLVLNLLSIAALHVNAAGSQAFCIHTLSDGRTIDLNRATKSSADYFLYDKDTNYYFYMNICKDALKSCDGQSYGGVAYTKDPGAESEFCATYMSGSTSEQNYQISLINSQKPELGVVLVVRGGEKVLTRTQQMKITMNCAKSVGDLKFVQENFVDSNIVFEFSLDTPAACIVTDDNNLGGLGYLGLALLLIIIIMILYFAIGYIVNCLALNKEGGWSYTQLPQFKYWKLLFQLAWEGCLFIKEGIQSLIFKFILRRAIYDQI